MFWETQVGKCWSGLNLRFNWGLHHWPERLSTSLLLNRERDKEIRTWLASRMWGSPYLTTFLMNKVKLHSGEKYFLLLPNSARLYFLPWLRTLLSLRFALLFCSYREKCSLLSPLSLSSLDSRCRKKKTGGRLGKKPCLVFLLFGGYSC